MMFVIGYIDPNTMTGKNHTYVLVGKPDLYKTAEEACVIADHVLPKELEGFTPRYWVHKYYPSR